MALQETERSPSDVTPSDSSLSDVDPSVTSLDRMHDIAMPEAVSWWPLAIGWYVLFAFIALAIAILAFVLWRKWRSNAYRREARHKLALANSPAEVSEILRQTALVIAPREVVAAQRGDRWPHWLAKQISETLEPSIRLQLTDGIYRNLESPQELIELKQFADRWIKAHR